MPDVPQIERQLYILSMLSDSRRGYTADEIKENLGKIGINVSRKTVERDIDSITSNFYVYEEDRNGKTVYLAKKYRIKNVTYTISELFSLYFAREVLKYFKNLDVGATAVKIIERIIASAPRVNQLFIDTLADLVKKNVSGINPERELKREYLEMLKDAIDNMKRVQLSYHSFSNDEITERQFDPYFLEIYEGCWHVVGYCHLRNSIRDFRVSRILNMTITDESFVKPHAFYENYKKYRFDKLYGREKTKIRLLFTGHAARLIEEYEYYKADLLERTADGLLFERTVALSPDIIKWILSFGAEVKVLEPASLKNQITKEISAMKRLYEVPENDHAVVYDIK
ncbi:MAG: WYL domain-containing transcriptional regulator [Firmicutes bacterium]|nr:WYL domain-containing transcriptional regulator [Bacillota bacterium]